MKFTDYLSTIISKYHYELGSVRNRTFHKDTNHKILQNSFSSCRIFPHSQASGKTESSWISFTSLLY